MSERTGLVLVGHGSHISPNTAGLVWRYVDQLRQAGVADEVTACFWKEQPSIHEVIGTLNAQDITVIPVFTAQGYFTQSVIPAELGLNGSSALALIGGKQVRYGKTPGEHSDLTGILQKRVEDTLQAYTLDAEQTTVALIGHGTRRNKDSRLATRNQVQALSERGITHQTIDAYLDDQPDIPSIYERANNPNLIVVPFFLAPGSHVSIDVPNALGLPLDHSHAVINGKNLFYTDPIGTEETLCQMIVDLAYDAGMPERAQTLRATTWSSFPAVGRQELVDQVLEAGEVILGELRLTPDRVSPVEIDSNPKALETPQALRSHIRETPFRPLASGTGMPRDWETPVRTPDDIPAVVETVYPGAVAAVVRARCGSLQVNTLAQTLQRQQGDFRKLKTLSSAEINETVETVCSQCIKHPVWHTGKRELNEGIPCPEACNYWMSKALEALS